DAAIVFASVGELVVRALEALAPGGTVVCAGIHMTDIPSFPYAKLWEERVVRSVANLTRDDGREFLALAHQLGIRPEVTVLPLVEANGALEPRRAGSSGGWGVLWVWGWGRQRASRKPHTESRWGVSPASASVS